MSLKRITDYGSGTVMTVTRRCSCLVLLSLLWLSSFLSSIHAVQCDLEAIDYHGDDSGDMNEAILWGEKPLLLRGFLDSWPIGQENFLKKHGDLKVKVGSEASIVQSQGSGDGVIRLSEMVENSPEEVSEQFSFDSDTLQHHPDILKDYATPMVLRGAFNMNESSRVLSVGYADSGLPLHTHGDAYLGLLSGQKDWFLYPPGHGPPPELQKEWNPFESSKSWVKRLEAFTVTGIEQSASLLRCTQRPGEVVYVPSGWSHATFNNVPKHATSQQCRDGSWLDITVGIGLQRTWLAGEREALSRKSLESHSDDYEALRNLANSIFHRIYLSPSRDTHSFSAELVSASLNESISCLRKAISLRPRFYDARTLLVTILFRRGEDFASEAAKEGQQLERLLDDLGSSSNTTSAKGLASAYYRASLPFATAGRSRDALRMLQKSLSWNFFNNPKAHAQKLAILQSSGQYLEAMEALNHLDAVTSIDDQKGKLMVQKMKSLIAKKLSSLHQ